MKGDDGNRAFYYPSIALNPGPLYRSVHVCHPDDIVRDGAEPKRKGKGLQSLS
jgi:hypothetical protein